LKKLVFLKLQNGREKRGQYREWSQWV